jgi:Uma2 family endonuclease
MAKPAVKPLSLAEFLDWDSGDDRRYELVDGVPVAMAPPSAAHSILMANLGHRLAGVLESRPPCTVRAEVGIVPRDRPDTCHQADLAVTCRPHEAGERLTPEPLVVVEVLSPSTEDNDRKVKLPDYRGLPSVAEVVLLDSQRMYCEVHRRLDEGRWLVDLLREPEAVLHLESIGFAQPLAVLYANVALAADRA